MLMPKKTKYRKIQKGSMAGRSKGAREVFFGDFGLQATEPCWLTAQQIESFRIAVSRKLKKTGKLFIRAFPDKPVGKKPAETRMGKGKSNPEQWVAVIKRDRIICEVSGMTEVEAREALRVATYKLPLKTRFVSRTQEAQGMSEQVNTEAL